jgi:hypothetical protein
MVACVKTVAVTQHNFIVPDWRNADSINCLHPSYFTLQMQSHLPTQLFLILNLSARL